MNTEIKQISRSNYFLSVLFCYGISRSHNITMTHYWPIIISHRSITAPLLHFNFVCVLAAFKQSDSQASRSFKKKVNERYGCGQRSGLETTRTFKFNLVQFLWCIGIDYKCQKLRMLGC